MTPTVSSTCGPQIAIAAASSFSDFLNWMRPMAHDDGDGAEEIQEAADAVASCQGI
jgi:hypothetical protein